MSDFCTLFWFKPSSLSLLRPSVCSDPGTRRGLWSVLTPHPLLSSRILLTLPHWEKEVKGKRVIGRGAKCEDLASCLNISLDHWMPSLSLKKLKGWFVFSCEDHLQALWRTLSMTTPRLPLCLMHSLGNSHAVLSPVPSVCPWCPPGLLECSVQTYLPPSHPH